MTKPNIGDSHARPVLPAPFPVFRRAVATWLVLIAVEFIHGILRAIFLVPVLGDFRSRQIGVFSGSALIFVVAYFCAPWLRVRTTRTLLKVGVVWVALTLPFELVAGHFVFGRSWADLASDYDLFHGGFLAVGMVVLLLSPVVAVRLRR